ncbi:winged helix-turn-helix domain-containing protein [Patescibacteria group bacterium]|nr:winged helix-turn-helix domain-containing protein [Patescibacteria group bacterium]
MNANISMDFEQVRKELASNAAVAHCAAKYGNTGDPTSMKACYLLRHYPELSVSQIADLIGVSVSAASRCLKKLNHSEVLSSQKRGQTVYYSLQDNDFTRTLIRQLNL